MLPNTILSDGKRLPELPPPPKLGFNQVANLCCPGFAVSPDPGSNLLPQPLSPSLAKFTSPAEHGEVADQSPWLGGYLLIPLSLFGFGFLACYFQCFKQMGQFVVWLGWEPQKKKLHMATIFC